MRETKKNKEIENLLVKSTSYKHGTIETILKHIGRKQRKKGGCNKKMF